MKFTLPLFVALVTAAPAFSLQKLNAPHKLKAPQKLKEPLTMITVTDWEEGIVSGRHINESPGEIDVDGKTFHQMKKYPIETHVGESIRFKVERKDLWDDHFVICTAKVLEDPGVATVHLVFEGEGKDFYRVNKHGDAVLLKCEEKKYEDA